MNQEAKCPNKPTGTGSTRKLNLLEEKAIGQGDLQQM